MPTVRSAKAKGKKLEKYLEKEIQELTGLDGDHVRANIGSETGMDINLSKVALEKFPFAVEAKARARCVVYDFFKQAMTNSEGLYPMVVVKADRQLP